jgi:hypothetical protein
MLQASIRAAKGDLAMMERLFDEITDSERIQPVKDAIEFFEREGASWNDQYLATTTPGQTYSGKFAGNRILFGNLRDLAAESIEMGDPIEFKAS